MRAALTATDLACRRGERLLFRGLSLACEAGDAVHVAGPNGIGKSSLIRILAGLARPFAGTIERAGDVALVDERLAIDEHLPLERALAFWQRLDGAGETGRAADLLQLAPLTAVPVRYLSTGQRKRVAFARLLGAGAPIWLLDEPLNGLDDQARATVETLVARHCEGGGIAIVASHQPMALPDVRTLVLAEYAM